ncbi:MAG: hypothetical protein N3B15_03870 [Planctomycetota bacterium]|nr:hypothetical protein [Planctomycetota bacterium]
MLRPGCRRAHRALLLLLALAAALCGGDALSAHQEAAALAEQAFAELDRLNRSFQRQDPLPRLLAAAAPEPPAPAAPSAVSAPVRTTALVLQRSSEDPVLELEQLIARLGISKGVQIVNGQTLIVATGVAQCVAAPGSPGWIEARSAAAAVATLRARAAIAAAIAEEISSGRQLTLAEPPSLLLDGQLPPRSAAQIAERARSAAEQQLDEDLRRLGIPPATIAAAAPERKRQLLIEQYSAEMRARAAAALAGTATLASAVGSYQGAPCVAVALVWSQNLAQLSQIALRLGERLPPRAPAAGQALLAQVPDDPHILGRCFGVQRVVDEQGDITLLAYGQAAVPSVAPGLRATALAAAFEKAALEARTALKEFVACDIDRETQRLLATASEAMRGEQSGQLAAATRQEDAFEQRIRQRAASLTIAGAAELRRWHGAIDGVEAAGVVVSWSPRRMSAVEHARQPGSGVEVRAAADRPAPAPPAPGGTPTFDPTW